MPKFRIEIEALLQRKGYIEVEARSEDYAQELAVEAIHAGTVQWLEQPYLTDFEVRNCKEITS